MLKKCSPLSLGCHCLWTEDRWHPFLCFLVWLFLCFSPMVWLVRHWTKQCGGRLWFVLCGMAPVSLPSPAASLDSLSGCGPLSQAGLKSPFFCLCLPPLWEGDNCGPSHVFRVSWVLVYWTSGSVALVCMGFQLFVQIFMMSFFLLASYDMDKVITDFNVPVYSEICDIFRVYLNCIFSSLWLILACFFTCLAIF